MTNPHAGTQPQAHTGDKGWQEHKAARDKSAALIAAQMPGGMPQCNAGCVCWDICHVLIRSTENTLPCELDDDAAQVGEPSGYEDTWMQLLHEPLRESYEWIAMKDGE